MNLTCLVRDSPEPPQYIFWYHNEQVTMIEVSSSCCQILLFQPVSYNSARGGISQITETGEVTASFLLVQPARVEDSGSYSCQPSVGSLKTVQVHVIRSKCGQYLNCASTCHQK